MTVRDGIGETLIDIIRWLDFYRRERSQMYGVLINIMIELGKEEITFTNEDIRFASNYMLHFVTNDDRTEITVKLIEHIYDEEEK